MIFPVFLFGGARRTDQTAGRGEGVTTSMTVAWDDQFKRGNIMWKVPRNIRMNDNIVVREDEIAVFYRDGKALAYLDRPVRAHIPERSDSRLAPAGLHRDCPAGGGVLPPEANLRREVRLEGPVRLRGPGLRPHRAPYLR